MLRRLFGKFLVVLLAFGVMMTAIFAAVIQLSHENYHLELDQRAASALAPPDCNAYQRSQSGRPRRPAADARRACVSEHGRRSLRARQRGKDTCLVCCAGAYPARPCRDGACAPLSEERCPLANSGCRPNRAVARRRILGCPDRGRRQQYHVSLRVTASTRASGGRGLDQGELPAGSGPVDRRRRYSVRDPCEPGYRANAHVAAWSIVGRDGEISPKWVHGTARAQRQSSRASGRRGGATRPNICRNGTTDCPADAGIETNGGHAA